MTFEVPVNTPDVQPVLVEMWRSAITKARQEIPPQPVLPTVLLATFDGVGLPLTVGHAQFVHVTFPCRLLSCHIFAGETNLGTAIGGILPSICSASIELRLATQGLWAAGSRPVYATTPPTITAAAEEDVDIDGWVTSFQPGDVLTYTLATFTGTATVMTISLPVRRVDVVGLDSQTLTDATGDTILDGSGNTVVLRR